MQIHKTRLAAATALCVAGVWILCSAAVFFSPEGLRYLSGAMFHLDLSNWVWDMRMDKFVVGLLAWSIFSWVVVWCIATIYQRLLGGNSR